MTNPTLQTKLEDWLREQGYPLEMRAARTFQKRGWFLHHSRRYKDPNLSKEREIDLLAFNDDPTKRVHGHFVIECKWSPQKPWVLFMATQQSLNPAGHFNSTPSTASITKEIQSLKSEDVSAFPLFAGIQEGYALVQAFSKDAAIDAAYSAVQGAIAAADYFARDMSETTSHRIIYVPTVLLDGDLFRCSLSENGDVTVQPLEIGVLLYNTADYSRCVHIVRESALEKFIDNAEMTFKLLRSILAKKQIVTTG